jgi:hypothetical protein
MAASIFRSLAAYRAICSEGGREGNRQHSP